MQGMQRSYGVRVEPQPTDTRTELRETRRKLRLVEAKVQLAHLERVQKRQQGTRRIQEDWDIGPPLGLGLGYWDTPDGLFDYSTYDRFYAYGPVDFAWFRQYGWNWPFWRTWVEHAQFRYSARVLCGLSGLARGALGALSSYCIGPGINFLFVSRDGMDAPKPLLAALTAAYDEFCRENLWHELQKELFIRTRRDGESFLRYFREDDRPLILRTLEPAEIIEPVDCYPPTDSFGIINPLKDIYGRLGYVWSWNGAASDAEEIPAGDLEHVTVNVDRHVKRGLTDFFGDVYTRLKGAGETLEAMDESTRVQAEIAFIRQHATATPEQVGAFVTSEHNPQIGGCGPDSFGGRRGSRSKKLDIDKGQEYQVPPFAQNVAGFVEAVQAVLRSVAVVWSAPEWIVSGDASNNNYASSLTAESPFVMKCKNDFQPFYEARFLKTVIQAMKHACAQGRIIANGHRWTWQEVEMLVEVQGEAPTIETRKPLEEAQTNAIEVQNGVLSPQTWAQSKGRDYEQETANNEEHRERTGGLPGQLPDDDEGDDPDKGGGGGGNKPPQPPHPSRESRKRVRESEEREIITPPVGADGLFVQPNDTGPDRETIEEHNRKRFANHFHYADQYAGEQRTYDPQGDYNCGRCNMAKGDKCLLVSLTMIDREAGSCGDWEDTCAGDPEMPLGLKTAETSGYGIAQNGKGFGCHRCPFASKAIEPDSRGRDLYCGKGDFRVDRNACCVLNGAPVVPIDDKGMPTAKESRDSVREDFNPKQKRGQPGNAGQFGSGGGGAAATTGAQAKKKAKRAAAKGGTVDVKKARKSLVSDLVSGGKEKIKAAGSAAKRIGQAAWDKLPTGAQQKLTKTYELGHAVLHKLETPMRHANKVVSEVAKARGLSPEVVARTAKVVGIADQIGSWTFNAPVVHHAAHALGGPGAFVAAKVATLIPVASLAYVAYSTVRNPFATIRGAKMAIANIRTGPAHESVDKDAVGALLDGWKNATNSDWYEALVIAALDETHDLAEAVRLANAAYKENPDGMPGE